MTTANELIRERVDAFVSDLNELIRQAVLGHVQAALGGALQPTPVARPFASRQPKASRARTQKRNAAPPPVPQLKERLPASANVRPRSAPSSSPAAPAPARSETLLRILTESGRPMTVRTLALASTLPQDVVGGLVQQLAHDGRVAMRRGEVVLQSTRQTQPAHQPVVAVPPTNVHLFVVRRNGERVRRISDD